MRLNALPLKALEEAAWKAGLNVDSEESYALRTDYSGRAMYGAECLGLVHDTPTELIEFVLALADEDPDAAEQLRGARACQDSMGLSMITYWPELTVYTEEEA